jgi:hypothetical protein
VRRRAGTRAVPGPPEQDDVAEHRPGDGPRIRPGDGPPSPTSANAPFDGVAGHVGAAADGPARPPGSTVANHLFPSRTTATSSDFTASFARRATL